ncbi:MAG: HEAT repeat domain-containing protein [Planctomycetes bacterium]|nr:HEAT repeat domain-containing protein [Planctomycetota bacterium]
MQGTSSDSVRPEDRTARDVGGEFAMRLEALLKTMRIYGPEHPRRAHALRDLEDATARALAGRDRIGILARKDTLTIYVGDGFHAVSSSLASDFLQRSIRYLQISAGVEQAEFEALSAVLAMKPEEVKAGGGAPDMLRTRGATHLEGIEFHCEEDGRSVGEMAPAEILEAVNRMLERPGPDGGKPDPERIRGLQQMITDGEIAAELATLCSLFGSLQGSDDSETRTIDLFELLIREVAGLEFCSDSVLDEGTKSVLERLLGMLKGKILERMFGGKERADRRRPVADDVREAGGILPLFLGRPALSGLLARTEKGAGTSEDRTPADGERTTAQPAPGTEVAFSLAEMNRLTSQDPPGKALLTPTTTIPAAEIPDRVLAILEDSGPIRLDPIEVIDGTLGVAEELARHGVPRESIARIARAVADFAERLGEEARPACIDAILESAILGEESGADGGDATVGDLLLQPFARQAVVLRILERSQEDPAACSSRLRPALRGATADVFFDLAERAGSIESPTVARLLRKALGEVAEKELLADIRARIDATDAQRVRSLYDAIVPIPSSGCRRIVIEDARAAAPEKRTAALRAIASWCEEKDLGPLLEATSDKNPMLRRFAISLLATRQDGAAVRSLCQIASAERLLGGNQEDRLLAIEALGRQGSPPGLQVLREIAEKRSLLPGIGTRAVREKAREILHRTLAAKENRAAGQRGGRGDR